MTRQLYRRLFCSGDESRLVTGESSVPERDPRLAQIVRRHLDVDPVTDADANEVLAHLAGNMRKDFMAVGQSDAKHRAGQHLADRPLQFNWLFFGHATAFGCYT